MRGMKMRIITCFGDRTISRVKIFIIVSVSWTNNFNSILLPLRFCTQVSSIKIVTVYR